MVEKKFFKYKYLKRILDFIFSIFLIIFLLPLFLILYILLKIEFKDKVFFIQERPGNNNKIFKLYKFRSMHTLFDDNGKLLDDLDRTTKLGSLIRSFSIDELAQLINILKGEMSFIGPRPLRKEYLSKYTKEQLRRHNVKPGITGLAQIRGRNNLSWEDKFKLDIKYVEEYSLIMDLYIFIRTLVIVFSRKGEKYIYKNGSQDPFSKIN